MLKYLKEPSIQQTTLIVMIFAAIFAATSAFVVIFNETKEMQKQIQETKERYIATQKEHSIDEALKLVRVLGFLQKAFEPEALPKAMQGFMESVVAGRHTFALVVSDTGEVLYNPEHFFSSHAVFSTKEGKDIFMERVLGLRTEGMHEFSVEGLQGLLFVREVAPLGWRVASGVYLDGLAQVVEAKKEESHQKIMAFVLKIGTLTLFLYVAGLLKYRYLTQRITKDIRVIDAAFKEAPKTYRFVDEHAVTFVEFKEISMHANTMIAKIKEKNRDLIALNTNLEEIVEEKTSALQRSIAYTHELLEQQDRFVNNAIHEINTPLTIMMMNIELHNLKLPKTPYLTKIEAAAKVLENIYEDLGYVVKKHHAQYPQKLFNMGAFLQERLAYFQDVAEGNDVFFTCKADEGLHVRFNEVELQRIVDNNLSNAIKYARVGTQIAVELEDEGATMVLRITNEGNTISQPERLFERYYREDKARGGFGLGLNIVKEICDAHGVEICVRSCEGVTVFEYRFAKGIG
ncbi:MAG: HAMP domain-containing histidine kinase [Campylobacterales bacterium]|nr:HAMP domain-containing histidine kinase [Campylobacterales bacterium]